MPPGSKINLRISPFPALPSLIPVCSLLQWGNLTVLWMEGYPSGYSFVAVVIICILTVFMMAVIIIGNILVIISIFSEFSLQCVQNWFVASLAVADLALGIFVMPFSLAQEVMGYWVFGDLWCQERGLRNQHHSTLRQKILQNA